MEEGGGGIDHIRWLDSVPPLASYDDAEEYIRKHDSGWYDCLAVRYKKMNAPTKAVEEITEKLKEAHSKVLTLDSKLAFEGFTSEFIGCKCCGSRLARERLHSNFCPVCRTDMRSDTLKKQIALAQAKKRELETKLHEAERKAAEKNGEVMWLVKYEYHT